MKKRTINKLVLCALWCALTLVATLLAVPAPLVGNVNLGDSVLLIGAALSGGIPTAIACALGAFLADVIGGYAIYAPATLVIKLLMGLCAASLASLPKRTRLPKLVARILGAVTAEVIMILGYWLYESTVLSYGFLGAAANLPFNAVQGAVAILLSQILIPLLEKIPLFRNSKE